MLQVLNCNKKKQAFAHDESVTSQIFVLTSTGVVLCVSPAATTSARAHFIFISSPAVIGQYIFCLQSIAFTFGIIFLS